MTIDFTARELPSSSEDNSNRSHSECALEAIFDEIMPPVSSSQSIRGNYSANRPETGNAGTRDRQTPIGTATMENNGTIVLRLTGRGPGMLGHAFMRYPTNHPNYRQVLNHIGPLVPGRHKEVLPFD
ncbi:MAG: hypothetical protein K2Z81_00655 [Cyanobacteria bacterium]|nr:hypothetical protein [Cyanobacteriota bacterium]